MGLQALQLQDHALKIEDFPTIKTETFNKMSDIIEEFVLSFDGFDSQRLQTVSCRSVSGFIPFSHNKGGFEICGYTDISSVIGSGYNTGSSQFNDLIQDLHDQSHNDALEEYSKQFGKQPDFENDSEMSDFYEILDSYTQGDYSSIQVMLRVMYTGYDSETKKHSARVDVFLNATDAPYHRGSDASLENDIEFKTPSQLKNKLDKLYNKVSNFIGDIELY